MENQQQFQQNNVAISNSGIPDKSRDGKAVAGLVLGIVGLIAWFIPLFGAPIVILGLIFSIMGLKSYKRTMAIVGIVLSSIGLLATVVNASIGAYLGATGQHPLVNELLNENKAVSSDTSNLSKEEFITESVQEAKTQISLPYKIDEVTTLIDITAEPNAIRYHYMLGEIDTSKLTNELLKTTLASRACKDTSTKSILDEEVNLEYSYSVKNSAKTYFTSVTKVDCL